jgi:hypothetical protein
MRTLLLAAAALVGLSGAAWGQYVGPKTGIVDGNGNQTFTAANPGRVSGTFSGGTVNTSNTLTPSSPDSSATTITSANTWQTLFVAGYGTHGTYISYPSATVCVGTTGQTGACTCPNTSGAQNVITVPAQTGNVPFGVNATAMSICSATASAYFSKGAF